MGATVVTRHGVRFRGPSLTHRGMDTLSATGISLIERRQLPGQRGGIVEYLVIVEALDTDHAMARVRDAVSLHGPYIGFAPDPE